MENLTINGHIWFETNNGLRVGAGRAELLEQIDLLGSLSEAARTLKIPYRRAWGIIRDMNSPVELVIKEAGGKNGGGSRLTDEGKKLVVLYKKVAACFKEFSADESSRLSGGKE